MSEHDRCGLCRTWRPSQSGGPTRLASTTAVGRKTCRGRTRSSVKARDLPCVIVRCVCAHLVLVCLSPVLRVVAVSCRCCLCPCLPPPYESCWKPYMLRSFFSCRLLGCRSLRTRDSFIQSFSDSSMSAAICSQNETAIQISLPTGNRGFFSAVGSAIVKSGRDMQLGMWNLGRGAAWE